MVIHVRNTYLYVYCVLYILHVFNCPHCLFFHCTLFTVLCIHVQCMLFCCIHTEPLVLDHFHSSSFSLSLSLSLSFLAFSGDSSNGLTPDEMDSSVATLHSVAAACGADMVVLRRKTVDGGQLADCLVRRKIDEEDFLEVR